MSRSDASGKCGGAPEDGSTEGRKEEKQRREGQNHGAVDEIETTNSPWGWQIPYHFRMANRKNRRMPGEDEGDNYVDELKGLKVIGNQDFVSLECESKGDKMAAIPTAAKLIREQ
jgi:hypothetical protein